MSTPQQLPISIAKLLPGYTATVAKPFADPYDEFTNPKKLDVALKSDIVSHFKNYMSTRPKLSSLYDDFVYDPRYELLIRTEGIPKLSTLKTSSEFLPKVILAIMKSSKSGPSKQYQTQTYKRIFTVARDNMKTQIDYNLSSLAPSCRGLVNENLDTFISRITDPPIELGRFIEAYYAFEAVVKKIPKGQIPKNTRKPEAIAARTESILVNDSNHADVLAYGFSAWWSGDLCVIRVGESGYILPISVIPEIFNKIADHVSVLCFAWLASGTYIEDDAYVLTLEFITRLHHRHVNYPRSFFPIAGALEALATAILVKRHDDWAGGQNDQFFNTTMDDITESCKEVGDPALSSDDDLVLCLEKASSSLLTELSCLSKMSGHPITSTEAGMIKLHERTTRPRTVKVEAVAFTVQSLKQDFLKEYFSQEGCYPPNMSFKEGLNARLAVAFQQSLDFDHPSLNHLGGYTNQDFVNIMIGQFEELDYLDNILPYLKDKAASVVQSKVWRKYILNQRRTGDITAKEEKLLLMYILGDPEEIDHVSFIKEFEQHMGSIEDFMEHFAIRLVPKEKELKETARMFGCMTYKWRATTQVVLRFMQRYLKRYCSSQAMVTTELELSKKLYAFSRKKSLGGGMRAFTICLDAEGWNTAFTKETVGPVLGGTIDRMLGSSLPSTIHEAFEYTLFYAREKGRVIYYHGQNGGIEGLLQSSWMLVYIHQIRFALQSCRFHYDILIKGDDVRIRFEIPTTEIPPGIEPQVLEGLRKDAIDGLAKFGHKIKVLDSYYSENVLVFSKKVFVEDVSLPSSFRQIQKAYAANNAFVFTTDDMIGGAYSNAHSASGYGVNCVAAYGVALIWAMIHLLTNGVFRNLTDDQLLAATLTPSALGGPPIIYLHNMYVRAESDLVSAFCGLTLYLQKYNPRLFSIMEQVGNYRISTDPSVALLVEDPYALPRFPYSSPHTTLTRTLERSLERHARNPSVRALFNQEVRDFKEAFVAAVASGDIYDPKLMNATYECTICAVQEKFLQKFTSAKTIVEHLYSMEDGGTTVRRLCRRLLKEKSARDKQMAETFSSYRGNRVEVYASDYTCPTRYAEELRNVGWGKRVEGITYPPPQHQVTVYPESETKPWMVGRSFIYQVIPGDQVSDFLSPIQFWRPPADPYLGHHTPSGTIAAPIDVDNPDVIVSSIKKLLMLSTLAVLEDEDEKPDDSFTYYDIILHTLSLLTAMSVKELETFIHKRKSGTRTHHLSARGFRVGILPNMTKNLLSHVKGQVNTYTELRASGINYRINFMHLYVHTGVLLQFHWFLPGSKPIAGTYKSIIPDCEQCFTEIREENTYMSDKAIFNCQPRLNEEQTLLIERANDLIRTAMEDDERERDVRNVTHEGSLSDDEACRVVASEFYSSTLLNFARITMGFQIVRPTVERVKDKMMMKGRQGKARDITSSELIKIPASILVEFLREAVLDYTYSYKSLRDMHQIHALYLSIDPRILPWASCLNQLYKAGKLHSIVSHACAILGLPANAGVAASRDYGTAAAFLGKHMSTRGLGGTNVEDSRIVVADYTKASTIQMLIQRARLSRLVTLVALYPLKKINDFVITMGSWGRFNNEVMALLALATYPSWSVAEITQQFLVTNAESDISILGVRTSQWFVDLETFKRRVSPEAKTLLERWVYESPYSLDELLDYLLDVEEGFLPSLEDPGHLQDNQYLRIKVVFKELDLCYKRVRELPVLQDLDDYAGVESPANPWLIMKSRRLEPIAGDGIERTWQISNTQLDFIPRIDEREFPRILDLKVDFTNLHRAYGYSTSAWVKSARLVDALKLHKTWKHKKINIACLADGDGGDARWFAEVFEKSIVVWNSLNPDRIDHVAMPIATRKVDEHGRLLSVHERIRCRNQALESGDLTQKHVRDLIMNEADQFHIVKHDASLPYDESRGTVARELWLGVLEIWVKKGSPESVMIQKVYTDIPETLAEVVTLCAGYSSQTTLVTLLESHCSHEAYLVCEKPRGIWVDPSDPQSGPAHIRKAVHEAAEFNQLTLRDCIRSVSQREFSLAPIALHTGIVALPFKCLTVLHDIGMEEDSLRDPMTIIEKAAKISVELDPICRSDSAEFDDPNMMANTFAHFLTLTGKSFYWFVVHFSLKILLDEGVFPKKTRSSVIKVAIKTACTEKLRQLTDTARWYPFGGPFSIMQETTNPLQFSDSEQSRTVKLPFNQLFHAGTKLAMETAAAVSTLTSGYHHGIEEATPRIWKTWAEL